MLVHITFRVTLADGTAASSNYTITGNVRGVIQQRILDMDGARADNSTNLTASAMTLSNLVGSETIILVVMELHLSLHQVVIYHFQTLVASL